VHIRYINVLTVGFFGSLRISSSFFLGLLVIRKAHKAPLSPYSIVHFHVRCQKRAEREVIVNRRKVIQVVPPAASVVIQTRRRDLMLPDPPDTIDLCQVQEVEHVIRRRILGHVALHPIRDDDGRADHFVLHRGGKAGKVRQRDNVRDDGRGDKGAGAGTFGVRGVEKAGDAMGRGCNTVAADIVEGCHVVGKVAVGYAVGAVGTVAKSGQRVAVAAKAGKPIQ
jgi:hypothetical protein